MTALVFVDTNVLVYARDAANSSKQRLAAESLQALWRERIGRTSIQVMGECYATLTRKLRLQADLAWDYISVLNAWNPLAVNHEVMIRAREVERRYQTSWWDATIVASAQEQNCNVLLSEDFQDGVKFDQLLVRNPFANKVQEPQPEYINSVTPRPRHRPRGRPSRVA
jgi:predicted nucleic acid-binding protein